MCCGGSIKRKCVTAAGPPPCIYWTEAAEHTEKLLAAVRASAPEHTECPAGSSLILGRHFAICARDEYSLVDESVRRTGYWEDCDILVDLARAIGGALRVLDAGAHIGTCALLLAAAGHDVAAFEPHAGNFAQLNASVQFNGLSQSVTGNATRRGIVEVHNVALAARRERRLLWEKARNSAATVAVPEGLDPEVLLANGNHTHAFVPDEVRVGMLRNASWSHAMPLDEVRVFGSRPPRAFDLVKMDLNGGELGLVRGAARTFHVPPLIVKFEFWPALIQELDGNPLELLQFFQSKGYDLWVLGSTKGSLDSALRVSDNGQSVLDGANGGAVGVPFAFDRFTDLVAVSSVRWPAEVSLRKTLRL